MCHMSNIRCQVSGVGVRCQMSDVRCNFFLSFSDKVVEGISSLGLIMSSIQATMVFNAINEINI